MLQFHKDATFTLRIQCSRDELAFLIPGHTYRLLLQTQSFAAWSYGKNGSQEVLNQALASDSHRNGPIIFEHVSAVALKIEAIFEREQSRSFFTLPPELRDLVYSYLRHSWRANEARFTMSAGHSEHMHERNIEISLATDPTPTQ